MILAATQAALAAQRLKSEEIRCQISTGSQTAVRVSLNVVQFCGLIVGACSSSLMNVQSLVDKCGLGTLETQVMYTIVRAPVLNNRNSGASSVSVVLVMTWPRVSKISS